MFANQALSLPSAASEPQSVSKHTEAGDTHALSFLVSPQSRWVQVTQPILAAVVKSGLLVTLPFIHPIHVLIQLTFYGGNLSCSAVCRDKECFCSFLILCHFICPNLGSVQLPLRALQLKQWLSGVGASQLLPDGPGGGARDSCEDLPPSCVWKGSVCTKYRGALTELIVVRFRHNSPGGSMTWLCSRNMCVLIRAQGTSPGVWLSKPLLWRIWGQCFMSG